MTEHLPLEIKALEDDSPTGSFEAILSVALMDRSGEIVDAGAFEPLPASIPVHVDHRHDVDNLVGRGVPRYEGGILTIKGTFAGSQRAQAVRELVTTGTLDHMSVGYANAERQVIAGKRHVVRGDLVEASFVSVPCLPQAAVLAAKGLDVSYATVRSEVEAFVAEVETEL